ncbi:MAG: AAA family ATPase [Thermogemmata sp.]
MLESRFEESSGVMRVLLAAERQHEREHGRRAALHLGLDCAASDCVPLSDLRVRLVRQPPGDLVLVFLDGDTATALRAVRQAAEQTQQPVYAITRYQQDAEVVEAARAAGAADVWPYDAVRDRLLEAIEELRRSGRVPEIRGRIVSVTAAVGGAGCTTVATGLAFTLAEREQNVVLAELGTRVPQLALNLDLQPKHSLAELIQAGERMDGSMVRSTAVQHPDKVDVLAYFPETLAAEELTPDNVRDFQVILRNLYRWIVLDAGPQHGLEAEEILRAADLVVVLTRLDPPGLRLTRKYVRTLVDNGVSAQDIVIVANRYGQSGQVPWQKAEEALQRKIEAWLPDDPRAVNNALILGRSVTQTARWSRLSRELRRLASALLARLTSANS